MYNNIISYVIVIFTSLIGSFYTSKDTKTDWYTCIKPSITPPNYIFPIVWTILYIMIRYALFQSLELKTHKITILYILTLILNVLWTYTYFYKKRITIAFYIILTLVILGYSILYLTYSNNQVFMRLVPYVLWITFASLLNYLSIDKVNKCDNYLV